MRTFFDLPQPFGREEALAAGINARRLERAVNSGLLIRLATSLYAVRSSWTGLPPWAQHECLAEAAVRLTPDAIVSHVSHAVLLGFPHPAYTISKVTMTLLDDGRTSRSDDWRQFHRGSTPPEHIIIRGGHPYPSMSRTVIDCARDLHSRDALAIMDAALREGGTTQRDLLAMRRHQRGWPGISSADVLLKLTNPLRENWLESASAWAMHRCGFGVGVPQVNVLDASGRFVGRVDALWPELGVVGEADGRGKYELGTDAIIGSDAIEAMRHSIHAQREREDRLGDLGLQLFRWGQPEALAMGPVAERFQAAAARADPVRVTARFRCTCCRRELSDCASATSTGLLSA